MSSSSRPVRVIGNLAAMAGAILVAAFLLDLALVWFGNRPFLLCIALGPVIAVAHGVGVLMTCVGILIWALSMGKSEAGLTIAFGGFLLFGLPLVLPHYLGAVC